MNDKYSLAKCAQYGRRLAARLCEQHFGAEPAAVLDGPAVLKFTAIRQVNLLVVHQLMAQWQSETARLRSPYFDFEAGPVRDALGQFMNTLSRHIRLDRATFEPLLAVAAADTLGIVADPTGTFQRLFLAGAEAPSLVALHDNLRYLEVDNAFYKGFINGLPVGAQPSRDSLQQRFELYHAANYKAHQPMQRLVSEMSALLPLTAADLLEDGPVSTLAPGSNPATPAPVSSSIPAPVAPAVPVTRPVVEASVSPIPELSPTAYKPPIPSPDMGTAVEAPPVPLHEKLKAGQPMLALADALRASIAPATQAERGPKVETLREAISINQRFSFINELFNGENMDYHAAIQHLDAQTTADLARTHVTEVLAQRYDWNRKEEHVNKLLKLIERKFA